MTIAPHTLHALANPTSDWVIRISGFYIEVKGREEALHFADAYARRDPMVFSETDPPTRIVDVIDHGHSLIIAQFRVDQATDDPATERLIRELDDEMKPGAFDVGDNT